jgi:hypothetical protein
MNGHFGPGDWGELECFPVVGEWEFLARLDSSPCMSKLNKAEMEGHSPGEVDFASLSGWRSMGPTPRRISALSSNRAAFG